MKRCIIFAHFDKQNIIEDYVIYYLKELKKLVDNIIFVSDCNLKNDELDKISNVVNYKIAYRHEEYDFGSYKRGYQYLKENNLLKDYDELFFVNDSCFGPICPINFDDFKDCDFWGINKNNVDVYEHIQSFFLGFKKNVFLSSTFDSFINSIKKEDSKIDIVKKYEIDLTKILQSNGFKYKTIFENPIERDITGDLLFNKKINPFLKVSLVKKGSKFFVVQILKNYLKNTNYPIGLIKKFMENKKLSGKLKEDFSIIQKLIFRIQLKRKRIYILGKWYSFKENL